MENILIQKSNENKALYERYETKIKEIIDRGNGEYTNFLDNYNDEVKFIKNNSMYSEKGKTDMLKKTSERYKKEVILASNAENAILVSISKDALNAIQEKKEANHISLNGKQLTQITYVSSMINMINNLEDTNLLKEVFDYSCKKENFNTEIINLVYLKAKTLLNKPHTKKDDQGEMINDVMLKKILTGITTQIEDFKHDYSQDFEKLRDMFEGYFVNGEYPSNIYFTRNPKNDFGYIEHPWNV